MTTDELDGNRGHLFAATCPRSTFSQDRSFACEGPGLLCGLQSEQVHKAHHMPMQSCRTDNSHLSNVDESCMQLYLQAVMAKAGQEISEIMHTFLQDKVQPPKREAEHIGYAETAASELTWIVLFGWAATGGAVAVAFCSDACDDKLYVNMSQFGNMDGHLRKLQSSRFVWVMACIADDAVMRPELCG